MPTMAISNCLFSPTLENPRGFSAWCVLAKLNAKPRNTHSRNVTFSLWLIKVAPSLVHGIPAPLEMESNDLLNQINLT